MFSIKFNTRFARTLISYLENPLEEKKKIWHLILTYEVINMFIHDKLLGRKSGPKRFVNEFKNFKTLDSKMSLYRFESIYNTSDKLLTFIDEIDNEKNKIEETVRKKIVKFANIEDLKKVGIYQMPLGNDSGYVLLPKRIFINTRLLSNDKISYHNIIAHEVYHARNRRVIYYLKYSFSKLISKDKFQYKYLGSIIEEGIASLIELGLDFNYCDSSAVTPGELEKIESYFELLNMQLKFKKYFNQEINLVIKEKGLNPYNLYYVLGYYIAKEVYLHNGNVGLENWTRNHNYKKVISLYFDGCDKKGKEPLLDKDLC